MPITRPSDSLKNKINVVAVGVRNQEATAEDFIELSNILEEIIDAVEALQITNTSKPYYGIYTSIELLRAAYPTGEADAFALIDNGVGTTDYIAIWNTVAADWEISNFTDSTIELPSVSDFPPTGTTGKWYVAIDTNYLYRWYNSQFNLVGIPAGLEVLIQGYFVLTEGKTDLTNWEVNDKFRGWDGSRKVEGVIKSVPVNLPTDLDDANKVILSIDV